MPRNTGTFLGPSAPWLDDDPDEQTFTYVMADAVEELKRSLRTRIASLDQAVAVLDRVDIDVLLFEIRLQIAENAVRGDVTRAGDLDDLAQALVAAHYERLRKL